MPRPPNRNSKPHHHHHRRVLDLTWDHLGLDVVDHHRVSITWEWEPEEGGCRVEEEYLLEDSGEGEEHRRLDHGEEWLEVEDEEVVTLGEAVRVVQEEDVAGEVRVLCEVMVLVEILETKIIRTAEVVVVRRVEEVPIAIKVEDLSEVVAANIRARIGIGTMRGRLSGSGMDRCLRASGILVKRTKTDELLQTSKLLDWRFANYLGTGASFPLLPLSKLRQPKRTFGKIPRRPLKHLSKKKL